MAKIIDKGPALKVVRDADNIKYYNKEDGNGNQILFASVESEIFILRFNGSIVESFHFTQNDNGLEFITEPKSESFNDLLDQIILFIRLDIQEGLESFFLSARGSFGTGGGWADEGFISFMPVLLFSASLTERAIYIFYAITRSRFDKVNPKVGFVVYSTNPPSLGEAVRWQLTCKYIADTESPMDPADEVLFQTQVLPTLVSDSRQGDILSFELNKDLIKDQDIIHFNLQRLGGDVADTYGSDIAVGQAGVILQTVSQNPV